MPDDQELYAVTTVDLSGVPDVVLTHGRNQAISHFMQLAYLFAHAAPKQRFRVVGNDEDARLSGLHLIWENQGDALALVSLSRPAGLVPQQGWSPPDFGAKSFVHVARNLDTAMQKSAGALCDEELERLRNSRAASSLSHPLAGQMLQEWLSLNLPGQVPAAAAKQAWAAMASVRQFVTLSAQVHSPDAQRIE